MKKMYFALLLFMLFGAMAAHAVIRNVQVSDFQFSPANMNNVNVGDTIQWTWVNGSHTTTSEGIPAGATAWNSPINSSNHTFRYRVMVAGTYNYVCTPHAPGMAGSFTATGVSSAVPVEAEPFFLLKGNVTSDDILVDLNLPASAEIDIRMFNIVGRQVRSFLSERRAAGAYFESYYVGDLPKGIYLLAVTADNRRVTRRVIVE